MMTTFEFREIIEELENEFSHRGLKFTTTFMGVLPVQAYGHIDGKRFYFRYRSDNATLKVGVFNEITEEKEFYSSRNRNLGALFVLEQQYLNGEIEESSYVFKKAIFSRSSYEKQTGNEDDYYPNYCVETIRIEGYLNEPFSGVLSPAEAKDVFTKLLNKLSF